MATEEFKITVNNLFKDYISLRKLMKEEGYENVSLSFQQYLDFYIKYKEQEDYDDIDLEDDSSEEDDE